jgi:hypothetical protein
VHNPSVTDEATLQLLDRFQVAVRSAVPVVALWAHGSLAGGDYRPGRSDLDLIAVLDAPSTAETAARVRHVHESLNAPLLHCGYLPVSEVTDPMRPHLAWAHEELLHRPVTPVTRRELHEFGRVLHGPAPAAILPPVPDEQLTEFVVSDLARFWRPSLEHTNWWLRDIWVDLGLLTLARAMVTLRDGRLITKREALEVLTELGAPAEVVEDIRRRRYGRPPTSDEQWPTRRAELTLAFLRVAIDRVIGGHTT